MSAALLDLDPTRYTRHGLHASERNWPETNCYTDLWIEVLHARGLEPAAALGFTVTQDFEGDQFTFFKPPAEDLEALFGVVVQELAIFDDLAVHIETQVARGRLVLVEVDGFFLPDTAGVSYRLEHGKTTVGVNAIDRAARRLDYFHNAGFFRVEGEDFDGLFDQTAPEGFARLFPYVEFARFGPALPAHELAPAARVILGRHLARRPAGNPIAAYRAALPDHLAWLSQRAPGFFHPYAFNTLRQLGANFELLGAHLAWLAAHGSPALAGAAREADAIAEGAKLLQFQLARALARQRFDALDAPLATLAAHHDSLIATLVSELGAAPGRGTDAA